jgi:hypothetical protein
MIKSTHPAATSSHASRLATSDAETSRPGKANHRAVTSVVLVHDAWVDGSGWFEVYNILTRDG